MLRLNYKLIMLSSILSSSVYAADRIINVYSLTSYDVINQTTKVDLSDQTLLIKSDYGINNENATIFPNVFNGVTKAKLPSSVSHTGNIVAKWQAIENGSSIDLSFTPIKFIDISTNALYTGFSSVLDYLNQNNLSNNLVREIKKSANIEEYEANMNKLNPLFLFDYAMPALQNILVEEIIPFYSKIENYNSGYQGTNFFWMKAFGEHYAQSKHLTKNLPDYKGKLYGLTLGINNLFIKTASNSGLGLTLAYNHTHTNFDILNKTKGITGTFFFYGTFLNKYHFFTDWSAGLGLHKEMLNKKYSINNYTNSSNTSSFSYPFWINIDFGKNLSFHVFKFKPKIGIDYNMNLYSAYNDGDTNLNIIYKKDFTHQVRMHAIIDCALHIPYSKQELVLNAYAKVSQALSGIILSHKATLNGTNFDFVTKNKIHKYKFYGGLSITFLGSNGVDLGLGGHIEQASSYQATYFYSSIRYNF